MIIGSNYIYYILAIYMALCYNVLWYVLKHTDIFT